MQISIRTLLFITAMKALSMTSSAVVLDWNSLPSAWSAGATSGSFDVDATNAGNDITVAVQANNGVAFSSGYPVNSSTVGGTIADNDTSSLRLRTATMIDTNGSVSVTISFSYAQGVNNVSFSILDVDASTGDSGYIDRISAITATPVSGAPNSIALTGVNASSTVTTLTGSGTLGMEVQGNLPASGVTDHTGDVTFSTDGTPITSITFTWNNPGPQFDPQIIALSNISFSAAPVPEIGSSFGALATCGGLLAGWRRRVRRGLAAA